MSTTRVHLGLREDLGADCANCFGLCCVALAFTRSSDFPFDKPAGDPCVNLDDHDGCRVHQTLRPQGFKGCTVFDCFGAGQKVSQHTFGGRSWRTDAATRASMFAVFPIVRRLHELLWYLDRALELASAAPSQRQTPDPGRQPLADLFDTVLALSNAAPDSLLASHVDHLYDEARPLLIAASRRARAGANVSTATVSTANRSTANISRADLSSTDLSGTDLSGANLSGADLRGADLRGALLIGAAFTGADLSWCDLLGADLRDSDLSGANLATAIFLTQMQVNSARGDAATQLPHAFARPSHW